MLAPWPDDPGLLVKSQAPRSSPWRLIMIGDSPGDFIESDILANLNEPNVLEDVSWIRAGQVIVGLVVVQPVWSGCGF